ncbi:bifunctional methylenetetrahydrofolate dehydrogenase/cyclohydrolase, mitochondrial isoform X1 [Zalophus californianus]|uniref:Bifunctional methylenetetrahydrofolate dehydrogenase/cyclohydrolase, mitochondrial isoform X1 n=2 Tax=Otariidae TaxID=9702 RepID=A0A6J2FC44_ZALCA|nr:bifunctional methylenetetrahydrofolate dehydrogenase/cyclohydrolase, mitochondrial isoform X1 [Zalophus californianus]
MNEQTLTRAGPASVTSAASGRGLPSSANLCRLPGLPSLPGLPCWLFLLQSQAGLCWEVANGCGRKAGPATRPRYNCTARARASLLARTLARVMAAVSVVSTLATRLLRLAQSCRLRYRPFHLSVVRNEAVVISGRKLAQQIKREVWQEVEEWVASGNKRPHLSVVLVGENPASHSYVLNKTRAAAEVGINSETIVKPASISEEELLNLVNKLNNDDNVDGLLVQLPLPEHIDERKICNAVSPDKDVDGFHVINVGRMCLDQYSMLPATPWGVWEIIKRTGIPTLGKNVVVAGRSKNVGMPIAMLLHTDGAHERPGGDATVTISHRYTPKEQLKKHTVLADIVVSAAGIPNLITADMIKEGAAVIDVGINRVQDPITAKPKLVGDVDFEGVKKKAGYITPVPGGVGPMTVAMLMKNTIIAAKKVLRLEEQEVLKPKERGVATN